MSSGTTADYFDEILGEGLSICKLCKAKLTNGRSSNLKRHLKTLHQVDVASKRDVCSTEMKAAYKQQRKRNIMIDISLSRLFRSYLGLITEDNAPLALLNSANLRSLMDPICKRIQKNTGKKIQLNANTCQKALHLVADDARKSIKEEIKSQLLSIKVNLLHSISDDNTFIISAHFFKEDAMRAITLGLVTLGAVRNSSKLTVEIINTLSKYDIVRDQVVSITVDNETDVCLSSITTTFDNATGIPLEDIQLCRCAARVAYLCCQDVIENAEIMEYLKICRNIVRFIDKSQSCQEAFELNDDIRVKPELDCQSHWLSTYTMVYGLQTAKKIVDDPQFVSKEQFEITPSLWDFVDCFVEAMGPLQRTITRYQEEHLHYSHFYAQWLKCKLSTECIVQNNAANDNCLKYKIATIVVDSMKYREISNECLYACLFLDPRFHRMLNLVQRSEAIRFLKKLWDKICHLNPGVSELGNIPAATVVSADTEDQLLDKFLSESIHHKPEVDCVTVYSKIDCLQLPFMKSDTDVLMFWNDKRHAEQELYQLSNICFAIPATQIISNSVVEAVKLIMESNRNCTNENLENILLIKLNSSYLDNVVPDSLLPYFENAAEKDKSNVHNDPLLLYEDGANSWPDLDENSVNMSDDAEDNNKADSSVLNDPTDDGRYNSFNIKEEIGNKPKLSLDNNTSTNEISIKYENINIDEESQLSNESFQELANSTAAHESTEDQSITNKNPERSTRSKLKRGRKKGECLCVECGKKFATLHSFKTHMLRHEGNKKFQCPHCPKSFVCSSGLCTHVRIHRPDKPHVCEICARSFRSKYELKVHSRYHTGIRNHKCDYCDLRFVTGEQRRRHMRTHTGEKPYKCKYCDRAFAQSNDCNKHMKQHLGDNIFPCELCPQRFPFARDLRVHFATHKDDDEETRARYLAAREVEERKLKTNLGVVV